MDPFSALLAVCAGNSPVTGEFPSQRPVVRSFDVFFDLCLNKRLSKRSWGWWFETPSRSSWRHCNVVVTKQILFLCYFSVFRGWINLRLLYIYCSLRINTPNDIHHVHIWHVSPQLSCSDTCRINNQTWPNRYNFPEAKTPTTAKWHDGANSDPHPCFLPVIWLPSPLTPIMPHLSQGATTCCSGQRTAADSGTSCEN